jgi:restriction system protein
MGYGGSRANAGRRVGKTADGGIDGIINEDPLGLDIVYLQAKRYAQGNTVGVDKVREFAGALVERGAPRVYSSPLASLHRLPKPLLSVYRSGSS